VVIEFGLADIVLLKIPRLRSEWLYGA